MIDIDSLGILPLLAIATPWIGAIAAWLTRDRERARTHSILASGAALVLATASWMAFSWTRPSDLVEGQIPITLWQPSELLGVDILNAPLIPLAALLYFVTILGTLRTKIRRFPFGWTLLSEGLLLATLASRTPWLMIGLLSLQIVPPACELISRGRSSRVFLVHMLPSMAFLALGQLLLDFDGGSRFLGYVGVGLLTLGILIRSGGVPLHCWMSDLFENATMGTALLFCAPITSAYAAVRLLLPVAPDAALRVVAVVSLTTAIYAAAMALIQREARRFFSYLLLSNASLVLAGLDILNPIALTGALSVWLSVSMSLAGLGLTLRALESRTGRLSLATYHGLYEHTPTLAAFFVVTGLASVGFPGTVGFIGTELLVEGAVHAAPRVGLLVLFTAALNGIAILKAYFRLFAGNVHTASVSLKARRSERAAVLTLSCLIIGGGLVPQPGVASRYDAARQILLSRAANISPDQQEPIAEAMSRIIAGDAMTNPDHVHRRDLHTAELLSQYQE